MKKLHYLLIHLYCVTALMLAGYYVLDQLGYQYAVIYMMRAQALAIQSIGKGNLN